MAGDTNDSNDISIKQCAICNNDFDGDDIIGCDGECHNCFHTKCVAIKAKEFKVIQDCAGLKFYCENCRADKSIGLKDVQILIDNALKKYEQQIVEYKKFVKQLCSKQRCL